VREFIPTSLGVALIEGFDRMRFETSLGKPFLRKEMELKMKAICEGRTTKQAVLHESLGEYRQVYDQSRAELNILKAVSGCPVFFLLCLVTFYWIFCLFLFSSSRLTQPNRPAGNMSSRTEDDESIPHVDAVLPPGTPHHRTNVRLCGFENAGNVAFSWMTPNRGAEGGEYG
jgi:hypothetical protein